MTLQESSTSQLMRPDQARSMEEESRRIEAVLNAPPHIASGIDRREMHKQLKMLKTQIETQAPKPYAGADLDAAVARERELRDEILLGMPTQAEMRRNPAGAVSKHAAWDERVKSKMVEWKNIRRRLYVGGHLADNANEGDHANFELYRPLGGSHEINMHNEQIVGTTQYGPTPGAGPAVVMTAAESEFLKGANPEIHEKMALLPNDARRAVLDIIRPIMEAERIAREPVEVPDEIRALDWNDLRLRAKELGIQHVAKPRDEVEQLVARAEMNDGR